VALLTKKQIESINGERGARPGQLYYANEFNSSGQLRNVIYQGQDDGRLLLYNSIVNPKEIIGNKDNNFVFTQKNPLSSWIVIHGLGRRCSIQVITNTFKEIEAEIIWNSNNQVTINFNKARTGFVYCN